MGRLKDWFDAWVARHGSEPLHFDDNLARMQPAPALLAKVGGEKAAAALHHPDLERRLAAAMAPVSVWVPDVQGTLGIPDLLSLARSVLPVIAEEVAGRSEEARLAHDGNTTAESIASRRESGSAPRAASFRPLCEPGPIDPATLPTGGCPALVRSRHSGWREVQWCTPTGITVGPQDGRGYPYGDDWVIETLLAPVAGDAAAHATSAQPIPETKREMLWTHRIEEEARRRCKAYRDGLPDYVSTEAVWQDWIDTAARDLYAPGPGDAPDGSATEAAVHPDVVPTRSDPQGEGASHVEIGGQRMTEAQYHAARFPLLNGVASRGEGDRLREVWGQSDWDESADSASWSATQTAAKPRLRACVQAWPECATGSYDPRCCRFPKSCSADIYDEDRVKPENLEQLAGGAPNVGPA